MALFEYNALDIGGKEKKGTIQADSEKLARNKLRADGLIPIDIIAITKQLSLTDKKIKHIDRKIPLSELTLFTRELCSLLTAGLEIEHSVASVAQQIEHKQFKEIVEAVHTRILEGFSFSSGLSEFPKAFPHVYIATIKSGEDAGHLAKVLLNLADYLERQEQIRQKVVQAIIYPCILTCMSLSIVAFLLIYVTPKIISIFEETKKGLPLATQILLSISQFLQNYGLLCFLILVALVFGFRKMMKNPVFKERFDRFMLSLPLIGKMIKLIETSRFLRTLAILTQATVPILQSFTVAANLVNSLPIKHEILKARDRIKEGSTINAALKKFSYFSPSSLQFIASGENSGNLEEMLMRSAQNQERHVEYSINTVLALFEPLLIIVMGTLVLFIVLATLLPIFQLSSMVA